MATDASANAQTTESPPKKPAQKGWFSELLPIGSFWHSYLWTEKSGGAQTLIIVILQFVLPIISAVLQIFFPTFSISLHHILEWPRWMLLLAIPLGTANGFWYPNAQMNGVEVATRNESGIDAKQPNRDLVWSVMPWFPIAISAILTLVGWGFLAANMLDGPGIIETMVREMLLMSPAMFVYNAFVAWAVKVDVGNTNSVFSEMVQFAGKVTRLERTSH